VADHYDPKLYAFGSAVTLPVHNIDTGLDYETIQEAIDAPETLDGHTIEVDSGTYIENVKVTKSLAFFGKDGPTATTVIAKAAGPVFDVMANYATIINFSVTNGTELSTDYYGAGIYLREVTHCNISNNIIYENVGIAGPTHGIYLSVSHSHIIVNNTIRNNGAHGIHLFEQGPGAPPLGVYGSHHNSIRENVIFGNNIGIYVLGSYNNLTDNIIHSNAGGICWRDSIHGMIENNTVTSNSEEGVQLQGCHDFIVRNNEISRSGYWCGLRLASSSNNTVSGNMLNENVGAGISIDTYYVNNGVGVPSLNNEIYENSLIKNDYGVMIRGLYEPHIDNVIYHNNFIDNIVGQAVDPWSNLWDDGYPSGGNYWSDYTGVDEYHGEYQNETCGDRIGDTPYVIDENNQDNYPLMGWSIPEDINNDGAVNILDIYTVAKAFGSYGPDYYPDSPPHERWNWRADINKDCKVDIRDIFRIALKYGWVA